jgi:phosphatidylcholine synthase
MPTTNRSSTQMASEPQPPRDAGHRRRRRAGRAGGSGPERPRDPRRLGLAWGVHAFTASGAVVGAVALLAVVAGNLPQAAILMIVALAIDSVDGTLARVVRVGEVLPGIDGRRLDDIVDYLNYVIVPVVFLVAAGYLRAWWAAAPILASAYGFSQHDAKTDDDFFLGFPSYWNVVALYIWLLDVTPFTATAVVVAFSIAVFVPIKYVYPSKMPVLRRTTTALGGVWVAAIALAVVAPHRIGRLPVVEATLVYPAWYLLLSFRYGGLARRTS